MSGQLEILSPGPLTLIQDQGRPGWASIGVGCAGAADRAALGLANRLVANPLDAEQGSSRSAALAGTTLAVLYATESDHKEWIAAFDVTDGRRVFTQELVGCDRHSGFVATEDAFVVRCDTQLRVLGVADGALRTTIGE